MSSLRQLDIDDHTLKQHQHEPNQICDARRRSPGPLTLLRGRRANNPAVVVRPQAPLPAGTLVRPPPDDVQCRQWDFYHHVHPACAADKLPKKAVIELPGSTDDRRDQHTVDDRIPWSPSVELDASQGHAIYQLPAQELHEADNNHRISSISAFAQPTSAAQLVSKTPSHTSFRRPPCLGEEAAADDEEVSLMGVDDDARFDCPIRVGPDGSNKCSWPPKSDALGFPSLARVREHVGSHGLFCPDCDKVFKVPTRFRDHRNLKIQTGRCPDGGLDKSAFPQHITLPPENVISFFERPKKGISKHDAWMSGYKILFPDWEHQNHLPQPFYKINRTLNASSRAHDTSSRELGSIVRFDCTTVPHVTMSDSVDRSSHQPSNSMTSNTRIAAFDTGHRHMDHGELNHEMPIAMDLEKFIGEMTWIDALHNEQQFNNQISEDQTTLNTPAHSDVMDFAFAKPNWPNNIAYEPFNGEVSHTPTSTYISPTGSQSSHAGVSNTSASPNSLTSSAQSSRFDRNCYWDAACRQTYVIDSAVELCDTGSACGPRLEKKQMEHLMKQTNARGRHIARALVANPPARKQAKKRIEKLMIEAIDLRAQIQALNSDKRTLTMKIGEVESEKQKLSITLTRISMEVNKWDLDDGEDSLSQSMQNIKLLLPDQIVED